MPPRLRWDDEPFPKKLGCCDLGEDVRAFGDDGDFRVFGEIGEELAEGLLDRCIGWAPERGVIFGIEAGDVEGDARLLHDESELLDLPLVHFDGGVADFFEILLRVGVFLEHAAEFGCSGAFLAFGNEENFAAGFDDVLGGGDSFYGLIVGEIERVSSRGGDDGVDGLGHLFEHDTADEIDSGFVGLLGVAGEDSGDAAVAGEGDVDDEIVAGHTGDFEEFAVERVVVDGAFDGFRLTHEFGAVEDFDGFLGGESGGNEFTAAGEAEHEVGFDEAEGDAEIGGDEPLIDVDRGSGGCDAEAPVFGKDAGIVVDDADLLCDGFADDLVDFGIGGGAVESSGDEDGDLRGGDAAFLEAPQNEWQHGAIGGRACDVADGDGGGSFPFGEFAKAVRGDGCVDGAFDG